MAKSKSFKKKVGRKKNKSLKKRRNKIQNKKILKKNMKKKSSSKNVIRKQKGGYGEVCKNKQCNAKKVCNDGVDHQYSNDGQCEKCNQLGPACKYSSYGKSGFHVYDEDEDEGSWCVIS